MIYVITQPCVGVCDTACVVVCPVDCIQGPLSLEEMAHLRETDQAHALSGVQLYIDPEVCIGCGACEPECPVDAIFDEDDLPDELAHFAQLNADFHAA